MLVGQRFLWIETNSSLSFLTTESMGLISDTNGIVRDGLIKSLHSVEIVMMKRELISRIRRVFHSHDSFSFESIGVHYHDEL